MSEAEQRSGRCRAYSKPFASPFEKEPFERPPRLFPDIYEILK